RYGARRRSSASAGGAAGTSASATGRKGPPSATAGPLTTAMLRRLARTATSARNRRAATAMIAEFGARDALMQPTHRNRRSCGAVRTRDDERPGRRPGRSAVEVPGIEPGSSVGSRGLLRAQSALPLLGPTGHADEP